MEFNEERIKNSGLDINIVDLVIYDTISRLMNDMRRLDKWQTVAQNDKFCKFSYAEILGNVKYRLSGMITSTEGLRKRVDRLIVLSILEKYPCQSALLLRPGENFELLQPGNRLDIDTNDMSRPRPESIDEVRRFFEQNRLSNPDGFFYYNERRGWLASGVPMYDWTAYARKWTNWGHGNKHLKRQSHPTPVATTRANMPLTMSVELYEASADDVKKFYKKSKLPNGDAVWIFDNSRQ